jgi:nicotinamidase-related amidase
MLSLVVIDMQKWMFRYPERAAQIPSLVRAINSLSVAFAEARLPIFNVKTFHKPDRSTWSRLMKKYDYSCLIEGTEDTEPVDGYHPPPGAIQIPKTANSAFFRTDLEQKLEAVGASELVLTGVFIDGCIGLTAADAAQRGYEVTLVENAIWHTQAHRRALIVDWLVDDYELNVLSANQVRRRVSDRPRAAWPGTSRSPIVDS